MKTIRVVAAVIKAVKEDGRTMIFATQRGYGEFKGGWEFPGGKIEAGETPQEALKRETIEKKMIELSRNKEQLIRTEVSKADALKNFTEKGDPYKVELIRDLEDGTISFYTNGAFTDLCRGPHLPNTGLIKAIKLTSVAGAYWRGNEKNKMLTRIYGISFPKKSMLDEYLAMMEEAKKRDHRKLGKELELFCFSQRVGQGLPLWLPKGAALRDRLEHFLRGVQKDRKSTRLNSSHKHRSRMPSSA